VVPRPKQKFCVPVFIRNELCAVCSADSNIIERPSAESPQRCTCKLTKLKDLKTRSILLLITTTVVIAIIYPSKKKCYQIFHPFFNCLLSEICAFPPNSPQWKDPQFSVPAKQLIHA